MGAPLYRHIRRLYLGFITTVVLIAILAATFSLINAYQRIFRYIFFTIIIVVIIYHVGWAVQKEIDN